MMRYHFTTRFYHTLFAVFFPTLLSVTFPSHSPAANAWAAELSLEPIQEEE
jgi:hypothetical protein